MSSPLDTRRHLFRQAEYVSEYRATGGAGYPLGLVNRNGFYSLARSVHSAECWTVRSDW